MSNTAKNTNATPADVAAKAAESNGNADKLIAEAKLVENAKKTTVPAQGSSEDAKTGEPELTVIEGGKKSLKDQLVGVVEKVKAHKRAVITAGVLVGTAALAFAKYSAKKAAEEVIIKSDESDCRVDPDPTQLNIDTDGPAA